MPTLNGRMLDQNCPDCSSNGKASKLVEVVQIWNMEEEGAQRVVLKQCPCGYEKPVVNEAHIVGDRSAEIRALRGERVSSYEVVSAFSWIFNYFKSFA